jgi:hypothetical protein
MNTISKCKAQANEHGAAVWVSPSMYHVAGAIAAAKGVTIKDIVNLAIAEYLQNTLKAAQ